MIKHLVLTFFFLTHFVFADGPYRPPNLTKEIFNAKNIRIDKISKAALFSGLICVARDFDQRNHEIGYELRAHALAIAGRLDPDSDSFKEVATALKLGGHTVRSETSTESAIASKIYRGVRALVFKKTNKDHMKCASYCIDIALRLAPEGRHVKKLKRYQEETGKADWNDLLAAPMVSSQPTAETQNDLKARSATLPGGKAQKFAATQRKAHSLSIQRLADGRHAAVASSLTTTALPAAITKGVEFRITQKVGDTIGSSLEKMQQLMRSRHEKNGRIPSGHKVEIFFDKSAGLIDGSSHEAATAISLDCLFTGRELDDKFAVTGAITAEGKSSPVGGIAAKIESASDKGFHLVGIPHDNTRGVSDFLILGGLEKFLTVQVFSFKSLDEAIAIASKDKSEPIQKTIDDFKTLATFLKSKSRAALKETPVVSRLESILSRMPNHQSARVLLSAARGTDRKTLSLGGSFHEINIRLLDLNPMLQKKIASNSLAVLASERSQLSVASKGLDTVKTKFDPSVRNFYLAIHQAIHVLSTGKIPVKGGNGKEDGKSFHKRFKVAWDKVLAERKKLMVNPEVAAELKY